MSGDFCGEHCLMSEHIKEAPHIREMVHTHEEAIGTMKTNLENITKKVDTLVWKVLATNLGSIIAIIAAMKGLGI